MQRIFLPFAALIAAAVPGGAAAAHSDAVPPSFGAIAAPATATAGVPTGFAATAGDPQSGQTVVNWDFGDGTKASGGVVTHAFDRTGPAIVTLSTTDAAGNTATTIRVVAVRAFSTGGMGAGLDRTAPELTNFGFTERRFSVGARTTPQVASQARRRTPTGTRILVATRERTTVVIEMRRRHIVRATLVRSSSGPGVTAIPFSGRVGASALPPGSYTANVTAIDGAGNRSTPAGVKFTIVKE